MVYSVIEINNDWTISGKSFNDVFEALKYLSRTVEKVKKKKIAEVLFHKFNQVVVYYLAKYATVARSHDTDSEYVNFCSRSTKEEMYEQFERFESQWDELYLIDLSDGSIIKEKK